MDDKSSANCLGSGSGRLRTNKRATARTAVDAPSTALESVACVTTARPTGDSAAPATGRGRRAGRVARRSTLEQNVIRTVSGLAFRRVLQGKAVVEPQDGGGWLIMFPDANVCYAATRSLAEKTLKRWAKRNLGRVEHAVGIMRVEWRG
jgi:hypothetical protein